MLRLSRILKSTLLHSKRILPTVGLASIRPIQGMATPKSNNYQRILGALGIGLAGLGSAALAKQYKDSFDFFMLKLRLCRSFGDMNQFLKQNPPNQFIHNFNQLKTILELFAKFGPISSDNMNYMEFLAPSIRKHVNTYERFETYLLITRFNNKNLEIIKNKLEYIIDESDFWKIVALAETMKNDSYLDTSLGLHNVLKLIPKEHLEKVFTYPDYENWWEFDDLANRYQQIMEYNTIAAEVLLNSLSDENARRYFDTFEKILTIVKLSKSYFVFCETDNLLTHLGAEHLQKLTAHLSKEEKEKLTKDLPFHISRQLFYPEKVRKIDLQPESNTTDDRDDRYDRDDRELRV